MNQSTVEIVGLGTERSNPDYYALSVMNEVFSGGFGSRVVQYVRTKLGLAYSVGGSFGASYDHPGVFSSEAGTKSVSTVAGDEGDTGGDRAPEDEAAYAGRAAQGQRRRC